MIFVPITRPWCWPGPPGAGKGTILPQVLGEDRDSFLVIDPDRFKEQLLRQAVADDSYEDSIKPPAIRDLEARGEQFFPMELASLVHEESSFLAKTLRSQAIK